MAPPRDSRSPTTAPGKRFSLMLRTAPRHVAGADCPQQTLGVRPRDRQTNPDKHSPTRLILQPSENSENSERTSAQGHRPSFRCPTRAKVSAPAVCVSLPRSPRPKAPSSEVTHVRPRS